MIMNDRVSKSILLVTCLLYTQFVSGNEITLDVSITGYAKASSVEAILQFYTEPKVAPSSKTISNEQRNEFGHFKGELTLGFGLEEFTQLYVLGKIRNKAGEDVAYVPLTVLNKSAFNERGFARLSISSESDINKAFENSYPISRGFHEGFINEDNLNPVLFSTRLLIEKGYVVGENWVNVFNSFLQNIQFFKDHNTHIAKILRFLRTYGNLAKNRKYYEFYAETLVRLDSLGVDGTEVAQNESLGQYVKNEWETLLIEHPLSVVPVVRRMIDTLNAEKRYAECVDFGGLAFKRFQAQDVLNEILRDKQTRSYVLSAMQGVTECFQLDFLMRAPNGSRGDVRKAAEFLRADKETNKEVSFFVDLFQALEMHGIFPRRPGRALPESEASRIEQIGKYYWWFTEK